MGITPTWGSASFCGERMILGMLKARTLSGRRGSLLTVAAILFLAAGSLSIRASAQEDAEAQPSLEELTDCVRGNFPTESSIQEVKLTVRDRSGASSALQAKVWWSRVKAKQSRALIRVTAPPDIKGAAVLMIERDGGSDLFLYSPELKKTRRITTHTLGGSLFGSDFTYEDFQQVQGLAMGKATRLPASELDGKAVEGFEQKPEPETGSMYERIVTRVTRETCIPVQSDMYRPGGELKKVMTVSAEDVIEESGARIPKRLTMTDKIGGTSSTLEILSMQINKKIPRKVFDLGNLER